MPPPSSCPLSFPSFLQSPVTSHLSPITSLQSPTPSRPFSSRHPPMNLPHPHPPTRSSGPLRSTQIRLRLRTFPAKCTRLLSLTPTLLYLCFQPTRTRLACPTPHRSSTLHSHPPSTTCSPPSNSPSPQPTQACR